MSHPGADLTEDKKTRASCRTASFPTSMPDARSATSPSCGGRTFSSTQDPAVRSPTDRCSAPQRSCCWANATPPLRSSKPRTLSTPATSPLRDGSRRRVELFLTRGWSSTPRTTNSVLTVLVIVQIERRLRPRLRSCGRRGCSRLTFTNPFTSDMKLGSPRTILSAHC